MDGSLSGNTKNTACGPDVDSKSQKRRWEGGWIKTDSKGRDVYILERKVHGTRFHRSTFTHTRKAALKQLERFEADPFGWRPEGIQLEEPLYLTAELVAGFWDYQIANGCSRKHANSCWNRLDHWIEDLRGVDLRKATLREHIAPALARRSTQRAHRISTIKAFYAWMREEKHLLRHAEDPTLDLPVPQSKPEKWTRRKAVEIDRVRAVVPYLAEPYLDCLLVMGATGWHFTELERLIRSPDAEIITKNQRPPVIGVLSARHKGGEDIRTPITDPDVLEAAQRRRAHSKVPKQCNKALAEACRKAGVDVFTFGVMRHTVATWADEAGVPMEKIAKYLKHKDERTTARFYVDMKVPTATLPLPRLRLVGG